MRFLPPVVAFIVTASLPLFAILGGIASPPAMAASAPLPLPKSITALAAIHRARIAIAHARQVCRQAIAAARRREAQQLKLAEKHAMHRNDLRDAVLINKWSNTKIACHQARMTGRWNDQGHTLILASGHRAISLGTPAARGKWYSVSPTTFIQIYHTTGMYVDVCTLSPGGRRFLDQSAKVYGSRIVTRK